MYVPHRTFDSVKIEVSLSAGNTMFLNDPKYLLHFLLPISQHTHPNSYICHNLWAVDT